MSNSGRKSPRRAANDLTVLLRTVLGEDRFPVDVEALALEVSRNHEDPITAVKGVDIDGFEGMLRARRKKPGWQILYNTQLTGYEFFRDTDINSRVHPYTPSIDRIVPSLGYVPKMFASFVTP